MVPLISIIIPTYNSEATVKKALESVLSQSFQRYEVLLIDGASNDNTSIIVLSYVQRDKRVLWLSEKDNGIYDAMNKGVSLANGQWILFLGSDDYLIDDSVFEDVAIELEKLEYDLVYGDSIASSNGQWYGGKFDTLRLHSAQNLCHQTIFYRKYIFEKLGKYNLKYPVVADWDFNIRCFRHPDIKQLYLKRNIVVFNNLTGVSSLPHDDPFYMEIPVHLVREVAKIRLENKELINSRAYIVGSSIYGLLKKLGLVSLINKFRKP